MTSLRYLLLVSLFFAFSQLITDAQDVILKKDQSIIRAKVELIDESIVQYKKWDNIEGPSYRISIDSVHSIHYENGSSDVFSEESSKNDDNGIVDNSELNIDIINTFNSLNDISIIDQPSSKNAKDVRFFFSISEDSRLADKNLAIYIKEEYNVESKRFVRRLHFVNTSAQTIYVDLANTFVVPKSRTFLEANDKRNELMPQLGTIAGYGYYCFYDSSITYESTGNSKGISLGLGALTGALGLSGSAQQIAEGIGLSNTNNKTVTTAKQQERIVAIPPHGTYISEHIELCFALHLPIVDRDQVKIGEVKTWTPKDTPTTIQYYTAFSMDPSFKNYNVLFLEFYISQLVGLERKEMPSNIRWSSYQNSFITHEIHGIPVQAIIEDKSTY